MLVLLLMGSVWFACFAQIRAQEYRAQEVPEYSASRYVASSSYYRDRVESARPEYSPAGKYRQPMSIVVLNERQALISTRLTGEVYRLDLSTLGCDMVYEDPQAGFGKLVKLSEEVVVVADARQDQLLVLRRGEPKWTVAARLAAGSPSDLIWDADTLTLLASGKWSRRLYRWNLASVPKSENSKLNDSAFAEWSERQQVDLPMCGGRCLVLPKHQSILVVDAFGRDYAVVDAERFELSHSGKLYGHNIADLAVTDDEEFVFFPHQLLNEYARSVRNDITWGGLMSNNVRWLRTERVLHERGEQVFKRGKFYPLGTPGNGAGDPTSMAVSSTGRLAITLGGTNRVAVDQTDDYYFRQAPVGMRPVDCAYSIDETRLFVVNQFSDSISIVDLNDFEVQHVALGDVREPTQVEYGEQAFFNSRLGHDGWMSCHSCHSEGHTNGQLNDNFSDNSYGTPKRILSLLGQAETMPYAWSGSVESLEDQVRNSIVSTMGGEVPAQQTVLSIAAFVRSLPEPPSVQEARACSESSLESSLELTQRGAEIFGRLGCSECHAGSRYTSADTYDVGLRDESDMHSFNPPSLISVSQRQGSLLHDGRAKSLRDVLSVEKHQLPESLNAQDLQALIHFLQSL